MNDRKKNRERQAAIAKLLEEDKRISVNQFAEMLKVSRETIRRDLKEMENAGIIQRIHGGAVLADTAKGLKEYPFMTREIQHYMEKDQLCKCAVSYIEDGDTIFVDNSTTTVNLVAHIPQNYRVTIITNSIRLLLEASAENMPNLSVICLGGFFKSRNFSLSGATTLEQLKRYKPNKAFLSCHGISLVDAVTDGSIDEVDAKREMIRQAQETFLLADSSKFGKTGIVLLSQMQEIDYLIADAAIPDEYKRFVKSCGTTLIIPEEGVLR